MRKIFTLLAAFLAIAGSAVWGQTSEEGSSRYTITYHLTNLEKTADSPENVEAGTDSLKITLDWPKEYEEYRHYGPSFRSYEILDPETQQRVEWDLKLNESLSAGVFPATFVLLEPVSCNIEVYASAHISIETDNNDIVYFYDPSTKEVYPQIGADTKDPLEVAETVTLNGTQVEVNSIVDPNYSFTNQFKKLILPSTIKTVEPDFRRTSFEVIEFKGETVPTYREGFEETPIQLPEGCKVIVHSDEMKEAFLKSPIWKNVSIEVVETPDSYTIETELTNALYEGPNTVQTGDTFEATIKAAEGYEEDMRLFGHAVYKGEGSSEMYEYDLVSENGEFLNTFPMKLTLKEPVTDKVTVLVEAYALAKQGAVDYYYDPETKKMFVKGSSDREGEKLIIDSEVEYKGEKHKVTEITEAPWYEGLTYIVVPATVNSIYAPNGCEFIEFLGTTPPINRGCSEGVVIVVQSEEIKRAFEADESWEGFTIMVKTNVTYNIEGFGSIVFSYDGKPAASYEEIPAGVTTITVKEAPLMGSKLHGAITITEGETETEVSSGDTYTLLGQGSLSIAATFVKDGGNTAATDSVSQAPEVVADATEITEVVTEPTAIGTFETEGSAEVKIVSIPVAEATTESIVEAYKQEEQPVSIPEDGQTYALDITPMYITSDGTIKEATISADGESVSLAFPYPEGLGADDIEDIAVLHMKKNGEFEYFSETNDNLERKETHIELSGIESFSPFVLIYTKAEVDPEPEPPVFTTYYDLYITQSIGAKLVSRHGKDQVEEGGSFTLSLEKEEGYEDCNPTVYVKRGRSGEWQEVKLDEVSGYYQIRDVYTDIYVKVSGDGIYPVGNESIEASDTKVYSLNGKIVVETAQPEEVYVVTMAGAVVANERVVGMHTFDNLTEGVYIVRVGETIVKLQVRN